MIVDWILSRISVLRSRRQEAAELIEEKKLSRELRDQTKCGVDCELRTLVRRIVQRGTHSAKLHQEDRR